MKLITVIIATYNSQNYIERCLRSLEDQTASRESYDIIVVNDGSTDNTASIVKSKFKRVILENRKTNKGLPFAINTGIRMANTRFVVRVDSDDYVHEKFLELLRLTINMNHECDAVACDYYEIDENERHAKKFNCIDDPIACGILFKHKTLIKLGLYDESMLRREEEELMMRFNQENYKLLRLPLPLYRYMKHENNISNNKKLADKFAKTLQDKQSESEN